MHRAARREADGVWDCMAAGMCNFVAKRFRGCVAAELWGCRAAWLWDDPIELRNILIHIPSDGEDVIEPKSIGIYANVASRGVVTRLMKPSAQREAGHLPTDSVTQTRPASFSGGDGGGGGSFPPTIKHT
ncbi:hypothetical protein E2C01_018034 [Portunus trituberculatus]|uniref:Uncharacterized protein n=1 Tax=Portunus trituberculatus TaxID=210409 RepID=A0A5B7DU22_PORTR|nr:hypothetical protein [Portunus trituberculatus]